MIQLIIPQPKLHFLQPREVFSPLPPRSAPCSCRDSSRPGTGLSLSLSHSLLAECLFICRIPNTGSKCQHVNGYTTVQTALGHYEPKRHQNRNLEKRKEKQKNEGISHTKKFIFVGAATPVSLLWVLHSLEPLLDWIDTISMRLYIYLYSYKV